MKLFSIVNLILFCIVNCALAREVIPFNSDWAFKKGPFTDDVMQFGGIFQGRWQTVQIPHTWNADDMQLKDIKVGSFSRNERFYVGDSYYRKSFVVPDSWKGKRVFVKFEGVNTNTELYLNTKAPASKKDKGATSYAEQVPTNNYQFVGRHQGGYSAFVFELTNMISYGRENELLVKVNNEATPQVIPVNHTLFPMYGGIYRPVELIVTDAVSIATTDFASSGVYITQKDVSKKSAEIGFKVKVENKTGKVQPIEVVTTIYEKDGKVKASYAQPYSLLPQGRQEVTYGIDVKNPRLWQGLSDPYLYRVVTQIKRNNEVLDEIVEPLGIRKFELIASKGFFLNDVKYPLYGVCRHQDRLGKGSALDIADHDEDLTIIQEMGATSIRLAHYQQSEYFYSKCDSLGLIVWAEIPFVNRVSTFEENNALQQMKELIRQNFNHPSIYIWGLHNEVYTPNTYTVELTTKLHDLAKSEDPDRYTVQVSGYNVVDHAVNNNADVQGINHYFGWYNGELENLSEKDDDVESWAKRISADFKDYKLIFSEYGAEAVIEDQAEVTGNFGNQFSNPDFFPEDFATRFHEKNWGTIVKTPTLLGSYLWNTFDFATPITVLNVNPRNYKGIVSFDRKVKKDAFYWYKANWSKSPVVYITQRRVVNRGNEITPVTIYSNQGIPELTVNGKKIASYRIGETPVHYIFEGIHLQEGENIVKAAVKTKDGKITEDMIKWNYSPAYKRKVGEPSFTKDEHIGL